MPRHTETIRQLEDMLNAGVESVTVGQTTTTVNFDEIRRRIEELKRLDTMEKPRRRKVTSYNLGTAW